MEQRETVEHTKTGMLTRLKTRHNRRLVIVFASLLSLVLLSALGWWFYSTYVDSDNGSQTSEYRRDYLDLKKNKPTTTQATAQADYYQLLASSAAQAGDYKGAVSAFEERKKVLGEKMPSSDYLDLAVFYCRMDDKEGALNAIQQGSTSQSVLSDDKARFEGAVKSINEQGCDAWVSPLDQQ